MVHNSQINDDNQTYFTSLIEMRKAHLTLMEQRLSKGLDTSDLLNCIFNFIVRAKNTGVLLGSEEDRSTAQTFLNYWSNELIRLDAPQDQWLDSILADYDQNKAPKLDDKDCPYPGLEVFKEADHNLFCGRTQLIQECLKKLESQQLLVVFGPPKSGKSSLVLAGLLPELKDGKLEGSKNWCYLKPTIPGSYLPNNLDNLTLEQIKLEQIKAGHEKTCNTVLVIDQFEDLFTLCSDEKSRKKFADNLLKLSKPENKIKIILTMRQDFKTYFENLSLLSHESFKNEDYVEVTSFTSSELKEATEIPAKRKGLQFEGDIVDKLVRDLVGEPMPLPLLQFVLMKLWEKREKNLITEKVYREVTGTPKPLGQSGVRWALSHTANDFYYDDKNLSPQEQQTLKRIFLQLLQPSVSSEVNSNRLQRKALYQESEDKEQTNRVIDKLSKANLLYLTKGTTLDDDQIEVVHPSLADSWHLLKSWLETEKSKMEDSLALSLDAEQWKRQGRNPDLLLNGKQIDQAHQLIKYAEASNVKYVGTSKCPTFLEKEFVKKSLRRRQINRVKRALGSLFILGLIIGLCSHFYIADLKESHNSLIKSQLRNQLSENKDIIEVPIKIVSDKLENFENLLESNRQSIQQVEDIQRNAQQLLQEAKTTQEKVNKQLEMARKISQEAEDARKEASAKSGNFVWGILTGVVGTFVILFLLELYRKWKDS